MEVNSLIEEVVESLPLAQCGGCAYPGCEGYTITVVNDPDVQPNLCFPGKEAVANRVAELTGKKMAAVEDKIALGENVKAVCEGGCIGCKMCVKACPADTVTI